MPRVLAMGNSLDATRLRPALAACIKGNLVFTAYSIAITEQLSCQFGRFVTLNPHQLAGHVANLEFWSDEVAHRLDVLDNYNARFNRLAAAQRDYVSGHQTLEFDLNDEFRDAATAPPRPRRIPDKDRLAARTNLCESFYRFIVRCRSAGLIDEERARSECERHSISVDSRNLRG